MSPKPVSELQLDPDPDLSQPLRSPLSKSPRAVATLLIPPTHGRNIKLPPIIPQPPGCVPIEKSPSPYWQEESWYVEGNVFRFDPEHIERVISCKKSCPTGLQPCNSSRIQNRRGAICEELEKENFPAKVNGVWMSLNNLRTEMIGLCRRHNKYINK